MLPRTLLVLALLALPGGACWAKKHPPTQGRELTILEISPMSVTVDAGNDVQVSYAITGKTKETLNGLPVTADDLRAGMVAKFTLASDNQTVLAVDAKAAPRVTKKPPKPTTTVVWW